MIKGAATPGDAPGSPHPRSGALAWRFLLLAAHEDDFLALFERHAALTVDGAQEMRRLLVATHLRIPGVDHAHGHGRDHGCSLQAFCRIPADMVMASGSGLAPHITLEDAFYQLDRVAHAWAERARRDPAPLREEVTGIQWSTCSR